MNEQEIKAQLERCGFANGEKFRDAAQVREYLTVETQQGCFGHEADLTQDQLDEMAQWAIENGYHMESQRG